MSDESHVNAPAIGTEIDAMVRGNVTIGGRFESPFLVVIAACETVSRASETTDRFYSLGSATVRAAIDQEMKTAIGRFVAGP